MSSDANLGRNVMRPETASGTSALAGSPRGQRRGGSAPAARIVSRALVALLLTAAAVSSFAGRSRAADAVEVRLQAPALLRVLTYDANLQQRTQGEVVVLIVVMTGADDARAALAEFKKYEDRTIQGMRFRAVGIPQDTFQQALALADVQAVYLPPSLKESLVAAVVHAAGERRFAVLGSTSSHARQGAAVWLTLVNGKPSMVLSAERAKEQGMDLPPELLRAAQPAN